MEIKNPISSEVRGWLYVAGMIFGTVATVVSAVLTVLGLGLWVGVVGVASGAFLALSATLSRANLTVTDATLVAETPVEVTDTTEA